jgi:hypothetical protein
MQKKIDIKSTILGSALAAAVMLSVAAAPTKMGAPGRYQLITAEGGLLFKFDTATGQVWKTLSTGPGADFMAANVGK